jgi:hypothetical protein
MPLPDRQDWGCLSQNPHIAEQLDYNHIKRMNLAQEREGMLNDDQREAYHTITSSVINDLPGLFFLD